MASTTTTTHGGRQRPPPAQEPAATAHRRGQGARFCGLPPHAEPELPPDLHPLRARAIVLLQNKWTNGTVLHYAFVQRVPKAQMDVVRWAFGHWKEQGIGLGFEEVDDAAEAELRIAFADDGSWSYVGTYNLRIRAAEPTMNFGWDLTTPWGRATALHEIGHAMGLPHEHQNPNAGIVWDEEKVYAAYARGQGWDRDKIHQNVIRKIGAREVHGTDWDPRSIMHYPFEPGLIRAPAPYDAEGTPENTELSPRDAAFVRGLYPGDAAAPVPLDPFTMVSLPELRAGGQADFAIAPRATRKYEMRTVGESDSKMVLFEERDGEPRYLAGDDDSAADRNATIKARLVRGRRYLLRVRLHYRAGDGFAVMLV
jgi:hypothetical protein